MLSNIGRNRLIASIVLVPVFWMSIEGYAFSAAFRVAVDRRAAIEKIAGKLGVDPDLLMDPDSFRAGQVRLRNAQRAKLLQAIETRPAGLESVRAEIQSIKQRAAGARLGAGFAQLEKLGRARAAGSAADRAVVAALEAGLAGEARDLKIQLAAQRAFLATLKQGATLTARLAPLERALGRALREGPAAPPAPARGARSAAPSLERITAAAVTPLEPLAPATVMQGSDPADLLPVPEGAITPEIQALADSFRGDPAALFFFVRDNFESELYYGVRKGAAGTLHAMAGNDADLSALLVALLRAAGIPARYRYTRVELTPEQAMQLAGSTDLRIAADAFASAGMPVALHWSGSVAKGLLLDHVYVSAYVPYTNYRGVTGPESKPLWIELDPWLVPHRLTDGTDLAGQAPFDRIAYLAQPTSTGPLDLWQERLITWARAHGRECETLDFAMRKRVREPGAPGYLPATVPATVIDRAWEERALPDTMQARVRLQLKDASSRVLLAADLPGYDLAGEIAALRFGPATAADQELLDQYGGITEVPPYLLRLKPAVLAQEQTLAEGATVGAGEALRLKVEIELPRFAKRSATINLAAGAALSLVWSSGAVSERQVNEPEQRLTEALAAGDSVRARSLKLGLMVLHQLHADARSMEAIGGLFGQRIARQLAAGVAYENFRVDLGSYGTPVAWEKVSNLLDLPFILVTQHGLDTASNQPMAQKAALELAGLEGSHQERIATERVLEGQGYSTVGVLQAAAGAGQALRTVTAANAGEIVPTLELPDGVKDSILAATGRGYEVLVHERPVALAGFSQAVGYILEDPATGAGAYRIGTLSANGCEGSEGQAGGAGEDQDPCSCTCEEAGSTVNLASGNYYFEETDLVHSAGGFPVLLARRYNSMQYASGALGPGWLHGYESRLTELASGDVEYVNEEGFRFEFVKEGDGYRRPAGRHWTLSRTAAGYDVSHKGGLVHRFDSAGRLVAQVDPNGNEVALGYADGRLASVTDATGAIGLTFGYDGQGLLETVTDAAGRTVRYQHNGAGDLVGVTSVSGAQKTFAYDGAHRLVGKTDYNGNQHAYVYDARGWLLRHVDPGGGSKTFSYDRVHRRVVVTDPLGRDSLKEYDAGGRPTRVVDAAGNEQRSSWDGESNRTESVDGRGQATTRAYDADGNLLERTVPGQGTTRYTYDPALGRVLTVEDALGQVSENRYDAAGNLLASVDAAGRETLYAYDGQGLPTAITRPGGAVTQLGYDDRGQLAQLTDAGGGQTVLSYDAAGHMTGIQDPSGAARRMEVDAAGRVTALIDAAGNRTELGYDGEGNRIWAKDSSGAETRFAYDRQNRLIAVTDPAGSVSRTEYDLAGQVTARIDARGFKTEYRYDEGGRLRDIVGPDGGVTTLGYCADVGGCASCGAGGSVGSGSKACTVIDPEGNLTVVDYDAAGRPVRVADALGNETHTEYDQLGRKVAVTDAEGRVTRYRYTPAGQLWQVEDALAGITEYGYDARGNRVLVRDANGNETRFEYDPMDRLLKETNPLGHETVFTYDAAGNRLTKQDPNGNVIGYVYDESRRLTDILYPDGTAARFGYDGRGNKVYEETAHAQRSYGYDAFNRVIEVVDEVLGRTLRYEYDAAGNRTKLVGPDGEETVYRYDGANRIREIVDPEGGKTRFEYDRAGRRTGLVFANGVRGSYFYDQGSRLESLVYKNTAGDVLQSFGYTHDRVGNRLSKVFASGQAEVYGYDGLHRLITASYPSGRSVGYEYDGVGNRRHVTELQEGGETQVTGYTYTAFNQVQETVSDLGTTRYDWDDNGNLIGIERPGGAVTAYDYDFENRLIGIIYPGGATNRFGYDAEGIRVFKEDSEGRHNFLLDRVSVLAEYDGNNTKRAWYNHNPQRIDEILSQVQQAGKLYHLVDGLGSVYGLVTEGQVKVAAYSYDAYGALTSAEVQPGIVNPYLFTGRELDSDSGMQYNRARYYLSGVGSWNREDPLNYRYENVNNDSVTEYFLSTTMLGDDRDTTSTYLSRFHYTGNPVLLSDHSGLSPLTNPVAKRLLSLLVNVVLKSLGFSFSKMVPECYQKLILLIEIELDVITALGGMTLIKLLSSLFYMPLGPGISVPLFIVLTVIILVMVVIIIVYVIHDIKLYISMNPDCVKECDDD